MTRSDSRERVQRAAETSVGFVIVLLAVLLLLRWHRGLYGPATHSHAQPRTRGSWQAYGIGLVHGMGGTAGVGLLLLATIHGRVLAVTALAIFALCTALSMTLLSTGFGVALSSAPVHRTFHRLAPALGTASLLFGVWYALGAQGVVPYAF